VVPESKSRELDKFIVRLPDGMREKLGTAARANNRTMNAEIVSRLEQSFSGEVFLSVHENTAAADIISELPDDLKAIYSQLREIKERLPARKKSKPA
jgi:hypothetical protein